MTHVLPDQGHRANNFDVLRLVGALSVMFAHASCPWTCSIAARASEWPDMPETLVTSARPSR